MLRIMEHCQKRSGLMGLWGAYGGGGGGGGEEEVKYMFVDRQICPPNPVGISVPIEISTGFSDPIKVADRGFSQQLISDSCLLRILYL